MHCISIFRFPTPGWLYPASPYGVGHTCEYSPRSPKKKCRQTLRAFPFHASYQRGRICQAHKTAISHSFYSVLPAMRERGQGQIVNIVCQTCPRFRLNLRYRRKRVRCRCEDLAELTKAHAPSLYHVLRLLGALDVFPSSCPATLHYSRHVTEMRPIMSSSG